MLKYLDLFLTPVLIVVLVFCGFAIGNKLDMRPPNTPNFHYVIGVGPLKIAAINWTAPESPYALGFAEGARLQKTANQRELLMCMANNKYLQSAVNAQNKGAQDVEAAAIQRAKAELRAAQTARLGRIRGLRNMAAIDRFRGSGTSCEQAEQLVRSFIR